MVNMNTGIDPTDLGSNEQLIAAGKPKGKGYGPLPSLERRLPQEIRIAYNEEDEGSLTDRMYRELGFSMPLAQEAAAPTKHLGFMRDGNIQSPLLQQALRESLAIYDIILEAECFNRKRREAVEEELEQYWRQRCIATHRSRTKQRTVHGQRMRPLASQLLQAQASLQEHGMSSVAQHVQDAIDDLEQQHRDEISGYLTSAQAALKAANLGEVETAVREMLQALQPKQDADPEDAEEEEEVEEEEEEFDDSIIESLIDQWSQANNFILNVTIHEDKHGMQAARHLYPEFRRMKEQRKEVELQAGSLSADYAHYFRARVRRMAIAAERSYDMAMGNPTIDYGETRAKIGTGGDIRNLEIDMPWIFRIAFQEVAVSVADGQAHRDTLTALNAQQTIPSSANPYGMIQPPSPYGPQPPYPMMPGAPAPDAQDNRPAIFNIFSRRQNLQQQQRR